MAGPVTTTEDVRREVDARVTLLRTVCRVAAAWVPVPAGSPGDAEGRLEYAVQDGLFVLEARSRGSVLLRRETSDPDQLLFWCLDAVISEAAARWEADRRRPGTDPRRQFYARRLDLMTRLDDGWVGRLEKQLDAVLAGNPLDSDLVSISVPTVRASRRRGLLRRPQVGTMVLAGDDERVLEARHLVARLLPQPTHRLMGSVAEAGLGAAGVALRAATYEFDLDGHRLVVPEHALTPELRRLAELVLPSGVR